MTATTLSKIILPITVVAFVLYIVGFACPYWLKKDFVLPGVVPVIVNNKTMAFDLKVESNIGLLQSCDEKTPLIPFLNSTESETDCGSDGAKDWQKTAAGFSIAGLILSFASLTCCTLAVLIYKFHACKKMRTSVVVLDFLTVTCMLVSIILYVVNKKIQVAPPLPIEIGYDINWAFYMFVVSAIMFALMILLNVFDLVWNPGKSHVDITKEPPVGFNNYGSG